MGAYETTLNPNSVGFRYWGGRGITICTRWINSFEHFLEDMGERPPLTSLDRKDNDGNYEPTNCMWSTSSQQRKNQRKGIRNADKHLRDVVSGRFTKRYA